MQPIYPANNKTLVSVRCFPPLSPHDEPLLISSLPSLALPSSKITGFITSAMKWNEVLEHLFSAEVSGVDCVLETETQSYTYSVQNGVASFV